MKTIDVLDDILRYNNLTLWMLEQHGEEVILHTLDKTVNLGYDKQTCIKKLKEEIKNYVLWDYL